MRDYRSMVEGHLLERLHARRLDAITGDDFVKLLAALRSDGLGERSCSQALSLSARVYKHAGRHMGWAGRNPTELLERHERPKPSQDRKRPMFERGQLEATIAAAHERCATIFKLLAGSGCRISEAFALTWDDLSLDEDPCIRFAAQLDRQGRRRPLKRRGHSEGRTVPIPEALAAVLRARAARPGPYVFATRNGRPWSQRNVARELRRVQTAARRPDGTPAFPALHVADGAVPRGEVPGLHAIRHTTASRLLHAGWSADSVARQLGHANAVVTRAVYLHEITDAERRQQARESLGAELGAALEA